MKSLVKDVSEFHEATDTPVRDPETTKSEFLSSEEKELRVSLIIEELTETMSAFGEGDLVEVADGVVDLMYVTAGTMAQSGSDITEEDKHEAVSKLMTACILEMTKAINKESKTLVAQSSFMFNIVCKGLCYQYGIPFNKVWEEVHRSNMAKVDETTGKVKKREDGKVLKPEGWTPPDIVKVLSTNTLSEN